MVRRVRELTPPAAPAAYPEGDSTDERLKDATPVRLRPIRTDEAGKLLDLYDRLSAESLYFRFFAVPDKDRSKAEYLAHVDYERRYALVAEVDGAIAGVARWECDGSEPGHAEVAFTVADDMQGKGLGSLLLARLAQLARTRGITHFDAEVLPENEKMLRVFARSGLRQTTRPDPPALRVTLELDPAPG